MQNKSTKRNRILIILLTISCLCLIGIAIYAFYPVFIPSQETRTGAELLGATPIVSTESIEDESLTSESFEETIPPFEEYDISLMAVGDNLLHMGIVSTGLKSDGTYDFSFLFESIKDFLAVADIKIINQETILGGNELGLSGYPRFNSPTEAGDAIAAASFNVVLQASNHTADQKLEGLQNCISFWEQYPEILLTGVSMEKEEAPQIPLLTIEGFTFAILNYTYGPNAETIPSSIEGHLNILCNYDDYNHLDFTTINPKVLEDIALAETMADIVIVCPHWGTEYSKSPSSYQKTFAQQMVEAGADLIIGTHPHVVEPVEWIIADNGNEALCYYSLGNYVSTQKKELSMLEAMAWVTFHVTEDGISLKKEDSGALPMVCQYKSGPVRFVNVYLLEEYTEELAASHGIHSYGGVNLKLSDLQKWSDEILGEWVMTKEQILNQSSQSHSELQ